MKLFLKRDSSNESTRFIIYDEQGRERYRVSGVRTASTDKMLLSTMDGEPLVTIRVAPFHVFYAFSINDGKDRFAMTATNLRTRLEFRFHGISWLLCRSGDMRSFEIIDADKTVVMTQNADRYLSTGAYELDISNIERTHFCIAAAICADIISLVDSAAAATV